MLAVTVAGLGCGPAVGTPTGDDATDGSSTTTGSTTATSTSSTATETTSATTDTDASSGSSSGEPLDGPGCGVVPTCDRGELVGSMRIESSAQIEDIAGYTSVTGWLEISSSDLECLDFLACIESVGRDVLVADNPMLRSLDGLDGLMQVGASPDAKESGVIVAHNDALRELDGFGALVRVDSLVVEDNPMLDRITGFDSLERIRELLTIRLHPVLQDLGPLADLRALGNECQITNNPMLCVAQAYAVCGDLEQGSDEGSTANNDEGCLGDAPPGFIPTHEGWGECSPWAQNCPPGEKCTWWANDGGNAWNATRWRDGARRLRHRADLLERGSGHERRPVRRVLHRQRERPLLRACGRNLPHQLRRSGVLSNQLRSPRTGLPCRRRLLLPLRHLLVCTRYFGRPRRGRRSVRVRQRLRPRPLLRRPADGAGMHHRRLLLAVLRPRRARVPLPRAGVRARLRTGRKPLGLRGRRRVRGTGVTHGSAYSPGFTFGNSP